MNILINYQYELFPFTTASYFELACRDSGAHKAFRLDNYNPDDIDFVLNIEPIQEVIRIKGKPSLYYEIDNHVILGHDTHFYRDVDMVLLAQKRFLPYYEGIKTAYLPLACYPKFHNRYTSVTEKHDIGILGNLTYSRRKILLEMLKQNCDVMTGTAEPGIPYAKKLNECRMIFNCAMQDDVNMRFFEAISCGRLLVTDYLPEQDDFAEEGKHYVAYRNPQELLEKVKFYLEHPNEREKIAQLGMRHIQEKHNYGKRLEQVVEIAKGLSKK